MAMLDGAGGCMRAASACSLVQCVAGSTHSPGGGGGGMVSRALRAAATPSAAQPCATTVPAPYAPFAGAVPGRPGRDGCGAAAGACLCAAH